MMNPRTKTQWGIVDKPVLADRNGAYLVDCCVDLEAAAPYATDKNNATKLWTLSEDLVGQEFPY